MSGPFKLKGWSPFTAKTKTVSRKEDQPLTDEQLYEQKVLQKSKKKEENQNK